MNEPKGDDFTARYKLTNSSCRGSGKEMPNERTMFVTTVTSEGTKEMEVYDLALCMH